MNNTFNHILNTAGILKVFNISKKVSKKDIDTFITKHKSECSTRYELQELLKEELLEHTKEYLDGHGIPGLVTPPKTKKEPECDCDEEDEEDFKKIPKKYKIKDKKFIKVRENAHALSEMLSKKKNLTKDEQLFFVISLVEFLNLSDRDFNDFHERLNNNDGFSEDDDDDDEDFLKD